MSTPGPTAQELTLQRLILPFVSVVLPFCCPLLLFLDTSHKIGTPNHATTTETEGTTQISKLSRNGKGTSWQPAGETAIQRGQIWHHEEILHVATSPSHSTHSPLSSSFLGLPYRIPNINHKKELGAYGYRDTLRPSFSRHSNFLQGNP